VKFIQMTNPWPRP